MVAMEDVEVGGSGARVARGIQAKKHSFSSFDQAAFPSLQSAYVSHSKGLLADSKGGMQEDGRSNTQEALGCDGGSCQSLQGEVKSDGAAHLNRGIKACRNSAPEVCSSLALWGNERLPLNAQNGEYPLGNWEIHGGDGSPSQEEEKGERYEAALQVHPAMRPRGGCPLKLKMVNTPWVIVRFMEVMGDIPKKSKKVKWMELSPLSAQLFATKWVVQQSSKRPKPNGYFLDPWKNRFYNYQLRKGDF
ncbi:hypothetical protein F0562_007638 [Nyssa sinensis]|uniref:Uncharacterized protein n=1 Tax=Nyssa sinensis TaxID=561372 RepID=A0A5J5A4G9_9ASTE|nr:hypothetical protein F0562_007638 [Nyssa sinensis]